MIIGYMLSLIWLVNAFFITGTLLLAEWHRHGVQWRSTAVVCIGIVPVEMAFQLKQALDGSALGLPTLGNMMIGSIAVALLVSAIHHARCLDERNHQHVQPIEYAHPTFFEED